MRLPNRVHVEQPWRIHELTGDFRLEDVWGFNTPGARSTDFAAMLEAIERSAQAKQSWPVRFLVSARWKLGALFGWDRPASAMGEAVASLRERLPDDLRAAPRRLDATGAPFTSVYQLDNEAARELANATVHAVMHLGWVAMSAGEYQLRMAVLVKPNGVLGRLYLAAIMPFRYLVVYPALTRTWERAWRDR